LKAEPAVRPPATVIAFLDQVAVEQIVNVDFDGVTDEPKMTTTT